MDGIIPSFVRVRNCVQENMITILWKIPKIACQCPKYRSIHLPTLIYSFGHTVQCLMALSWNSVNFVPHNFENTKGKTFDMKGQ